LLQPFNEEIKNTFRPSTV